MEVECMSLEQWMNTRKMILLTEKSHQLFGKLPQALDFRGTRAELYDTLSKMANYKRQLVVAMPEHWGIPMVA